MAGLRSAGPLQRARGAGDVGWGTDPGPRGLSGSRRRRPSAGPGPRAGTPRGSGAPGCGEAAPARGRAEGASSAGRLVSSLPGRQRLLLVAYLREKARVERTAPRLLWLIGTRSSCSSKQRKRCRASLRVTPIY